MASPGLSLRTRAKWLDSGVLELQTPLANAEAYRFDDLVIESGRKLTLRIAWRDESNAAINLSSGYTAAFTLALTRTGSAALSLTQASGITLGAGTSQPGNIVVALTTAQTAALTQGARYFHKLTVSHTASSTTFVLMHGAARVV